MRPLKQGLLSFRQHVFVRKGIYYYRTDIPSDLKHYFHTTEIKQSLKTKDSKLAKVMAVSLEYKIQQTFCMIRSGMLPDDIIQGMVTEMYPHRKPVEPIGMLLSALIDDYSWQNSYHKNKCYQKKSRNVMLIKNKANILILLCILSLQLCIVSTVQAQSEQKMQQCLSLIKQRESALVARDWRQLERLARLYVMECRVVFDSEVEFDAENLSNAMKDIVQANMQLKNYKEALDASQKCIEIYYDNFSCHVNRSYAFINLNNKPEAINEYNVSLRLYDHLFEKYNQELKTATVKIDKQLISAKIDNINMLASFLKAIRPELLNK